MYLPVKRHSTRILSFAQVIGKIQDLDLEIPSEKDISKDGMAMHFCSEIVSERYHVPTVFIDAENKTVFAKIPSIMNILLSASGKMCNVLYNVKTRSFVKEASEHPSYKRPEYAYPLADLLDNRTFFKLMKDWDRTVITQAHIDHASEVLSRIIDLEVLVIYNEGMTREEFIKRFNR